MNRTCRVCQQAAVGEWLDFGPQAVRNRFLRSAGEAEFTHPLAAGYCPACATVQLADPPPVDEVRPRFPWVSYNEPERHLDELVAGLARLPGVTPRSSFAGLTYKDDSTLARLRRLGFENTWRPDLRYDLGVAAPNSGIESAQSRMTPLAGRALAAKFGRPEVLVVRHVLEHTHDTAAALAWAAEVVRPGGYVVFEVPDATRALDRLDYTTVWEEHTLYFTPATLRGCLERGGFEVAALDSYPYTLEDSLVVIARSVGATPPALTPGGEDIARARRFVREFPRARDRVARRLRDRGRVAMLGAGHLTGAFLSLYGLSGRVEFVADDNPHKQGLFMPGSRLPILPSSELAAREIDLCLMTVRPEIEDAVAARNAGFVARGGLLASVFPESPYSLDRVRPLAGAGA